ncbi:ATP-binding cassette domain-containing protein [Marinilabiliaceae bacterium JC017]|nr:ATP-binding cassette domain-containing protein [Marinilabiliaceae bacterium JC017]
MIKLHVDSIIKNYGNSQVLTDIYLSCNPGEIIGLLGRNGTGKSTLLKIIFGSIVADNKFVKIGDKIANGLFGNKNLVSYLPQNHFLPNHVKVSSLISIFCHKENAIILKEDPFIKPLINKKSTQLSDGERRLLETFLVIFSNAKYILLDEPFNGIAPIHKKRVKALIKEQSRHKGFIITDHDYNNILDIATKTVLIHNGATKEIQNLHELEKWGYISPRSPATRQ